MKCVKIKNMDEESLESSKNISKSTKLIRFGTINLALSLILAVVFIVFTIFGFGKFRSMQNYTAEYIACDNAARQLKEGSIYLTEQARLYAMTNEPLHVSNYYQ